MFNFPRAFHVVRNFPVVGGPLVFFGNGFLVRAERKAAIHTAHHNMHGRTQRNIAEVRETHRVCRHNLVDASVVFNFRIGRRRGIGNLLADNGRIVLPQGYAERTKIAHREREVERGHGDVLREVAVAVGFCSIEVQQEVQVEHDLGIEGHACRVRDGKPFGFTRLCTAGKTAACRSDGTTHSLFFTESIETNHRRLRKRDKANNQS